MERRMQNSQPLDCNWSVWCKIPGRNSKHTGFKQRGRPQSLGCTVWCGARRCSSCLCLGHTTKAAGKTDCHLAQFIPPFVYSSVVNAVCLYVWFCSSLHTSALGILKSESTPHVWNIKQILLNMNKWINKPHSVDPQWEPSSLFFFFF